MDYMLNKINLLDNKDEIINCANEIVDDLKANDKLTDSEKLMTIELALAKINFELFKVSGDGE